ncbi:porin family protein [Geobacter sp. FeAm09]|uniref:porin family protein n=1 Tax=Geobacter sp. FeAm09 TaxID=2597769 RepID=UPI001F0F5EAB|nr:porin family protein [Geobacter sp. FeAm09]
MCACAAVSLVLAFSGAAFGAVSEGQFSVSPMIGGYTYDGGQHLDTAPMYSLRGGYNLTDRIGVEAGLDYSITSSRLKTDKNVAIFKYGVEGLYHFMPDKKLVPFVAAGLGGYNLSGPSALVSRKLMGFMDYGGGVKYFLYDRLALRADVRHVVANASAFEYTLGVTIPFGGAKGQTGPAPTYASVKAALAKKRQEQQVAPPQAAPQERAVEPAAAGPAENKALEPSPAERLAQMKELFAKEELERITTFKADWEKGKEARLAAERSALKQAAPDQPAARNMQGPEKAWNATAPAAQQATGRSTASSPKKSVLKKRHKVAAKKKRRLPAPL